MKVIGTAGHIDHGKSTLVRRLTGIDPDRLEEEQRRGMTIDLGFAWLTLPSGEDVSIVDVPGHERFIKNMLAGVGGIDVALLVVAADEAVMPQTREHLDILDLLGVTRGVVALSKKDLVDEEWLALAEEDVLTVLGGTTLQDSPVLPVSATTGEGIPELLQALDAAVRSAAPRPDVGLPFLPVDRVFTIEGFGTVVTGTLQDGSVQVGEELEVVPSGAKVRIRSLQTHRQQVQQAMPGARVAVNVAGADRRSITRGDALVAPSSARPVARFDARIRLVSAAPFPLEHGTQVTLHIGSAERQAVVSMPGGRELRPGGTGWVQIRVTDTVPAIPGQRFILRLPAPGRTVAGGQVLDVEPRHRRFDPSVLQRLEELGSDDARRRIAAWLEARDPRSAKALALELRMAEGDAQSVLDSLSHSGTIVRLDQKYIGRTAWQVWIDRTSTALERFHADFPLKRGMPREELRAKLRVSATDWPLVLRALHSQGTVSEQGAVVALPDHETGLSARADERDRVLRVLRQSPYAPPSGQELLRGAGTDLDLLMALVNDGDIVHVGSQLFFSADAFQGLVREILDVIDRAGSISVAQVRDSFGTSRKYALAVLEHLDAQRITQRVGDARVRGSRAPACT